MANGFNDNAGSSSDNNSFTPYQMLVATSPASVPEPTSICLVTFGLVAAGIVRRRLARA